MKTCATILLLALTLCTPTTAQAQNEQLATLRQLLQNGKPHSPHAIADAEAAISRGETDADYLNLLIERLGYDFIDISITAPGTMGDQILTSGVVTDFADVRSMKISGRVNADDLYTLKERLTGLVEIDMTDLQLTKVPEKTFYERKQLTWAYLPAIVDTIENRVFCSCERLQDMTFPATLKLIDEAAFWKTLAFRNVVLPKGTKIETWAFRYSGLHTLTLPEDLTETGYESFADCKNLEEVKMPPTMERVSEGTFSKCTRLKKVELNEGLFYILGSSFMDCDSLKTLTIPSTLGYMGGWAFSYCDSLKEVTCMSVAPPYIADNIIDASKKVKLHVPTFSVNTYKQSKHWDQFVIDSTEVLPQTFQFLSEMTFHVPDNLPFEYKPDMKFNMLASEWGGDISSLATKGSLTVEGEQVLSLGTYTQLLNLYANRSNANREREPMLYRQFYPTLVNNGRMRADKVRVMLRLYRNCWEFLSFPFDVKVSDIRLGNEEEPFVIRKYDAAKRAEGKSGEAWVDMTSDSILHAGTGYIWQTTNQKDSRYYNTFWLDAPQDVKKNNIFINDDVEVTLEKHVAELAHNRSWNFVGNPYPSFFDINFIETSAPIIVWEYTTGSYGGSYAAYSPIDDQYILTPGQAFFIQCPVDEETINFRKEGRQNTMRLRTFDEQARSLHHAPGSQPSAKKERQVFNLLLTQDGHQLDRTRFVINPKASLDYEVGRDASKFQSLTPDAPQLYTVENGVRYAINERPLADCTVVLGLYTGTSGSYTLKLDTKAEAEVTLTDHQTGNSVRLDGGEGYDFRALSGTDDHRFTIHIGGADVTGISTSPLSPAPCSSTYHDLQGRRVSQPQRGVYVKDGKKIIVK